MSRTNCDVQNAFFSCFFYGATVVVGIIAIVNVDVNIDFVVDLGSLQGTGIFGMKFQFANSNMCALVAV